MKKHLRPEIFKVTSINYHAQHTLEYRLFRVSDLSAINSKSGFDSDMDDRRRLGKSDRV